MVLESRPGVSTYNAIDPAAVVDAGGRPWLTWGSFWGGIKLRRLDPATGGLSAAEILARTGRDMDALAIALIELGGRMLMPGFVDAHHHLTQSFGKSLAFGEPTEKFGMREVERSDRASRRHRRCGAGRSRAGGSWAGGLYHENRGLGSPRGAAPGLPLPLPRSAPRPGAAAARFTFARARRATWPQPIDSPRRKAHLPARSRGSFLEGAKSWRALR